MHSATEQDYVEYVTARMPALRRLAYALCGDRHRADDVVQQAITRLYANWGKANRAAVDDDGTAVGLAAVGSGPIGYGNSHVAVWRAGTMTVLVPPDAGYAARPTAIADGWIGGPSWPLTSQTPNPKAEYESGTAARWNPRTGAAERIPGMLDVQGMNRYGWAVGQGAGPDPHPVAALGDRVLTLPTPAGADPVGSAAVTVSDDGRVIGGQVPMPGTVTAVRWTCD
jgi:hypothetical protein